MATRETNPTAAAYGDRFAGREIVAAVFADRGEAQRAIGELKQMGFTGDQIGVALRDRTAEGQMVEQTGTHAASGAAAGLVGGGLIGALAGFLIATGAIAIPGIGPVVAGGALASALGIVGGTTVVGAGAGAGAGLILGTLIGYGIPEHEARRLERGFQAGGTLVTVAAPGRAGEAAMILERNGGDMGMETPSLGAAAPPAPATAVGPIAGQPSGAMPPGYMVKKRTVTEMQTIRAPITREEYVVEGPDGTVQRVDGTPPAEAPQRRAA